VSHIKEITDVKNTKPAFEVTHVNSMQWNRTIAADVLNQDCAEEACAPEEVSPEVLEQVRAAIREEMSKMTEENSEIVEADS
jgi:hypothetical protein